MDAKLWTCMLVFVAGATQVEGICDKQAVGGCGKMRYILAWDRLLFSFQYDMKYSYLKSFVCGSLFKTMACVERRNCTQADFADAKDNDVWPRMVNRDCQESNYCETGFDTTNKGYDDTIGNVSNVTNPFDSKYCPDVLKITLKRQEDLPDMCDVYPKIRKSNERLQDLRYKCLEKSCPALQTCVQKYNDAGPVASGMDAKTCGLYGTFVRCVSNSVADCSDITLPAGQPNITTIANFNDEFCGLTDPNEIKEIFKCPAFTSCMDTMYQTFDVFSTQNMCRKIQGMYACAANNLDKCSSRLSSDFITNFRAQTTDLALSYAKMGCGQPQIDLPSCAAVQSCRNTWADGVGSSKNISMKSEKVYEFQLCLDSAIATCKLTAPNVPMEDVANITKHINTIINSAQYRDCEVFKPCYNEISYVKGDLKNSAYIASATWCRSNVAALRCMKYYSEDCKVDGDQVAAVDNLHEDTLKGGCQDHYGFLASRTTTTSTTTTTTTTTTTIKTTTYTSGGLCNRFSGIHLLVITLVLLLLCSSSSVLP